MAGNCAKLKLNSRKVSGSLLQWLGFIDKMLFVCGYPPLPRDGGTTRTAIQVHAVNLIEIRLGERWQPLSNQS